MNEINSIKLNIIDLIKETQYDEALQLLDINIKIYTCDAELYATRGDILFVLGRYSEAVHAYHNAIQLAENFDWIHKLAICYIHINDINSAIEYLNKTIEIAPIGSREQAIKALIGCYIAVKNYNGIIFTLENQSKALSNLHGSSHAAQRASDEKNDEDTKLCALTKLTLKYPSEGEYHEMLGDEYMLRQKYSNAAESFAKSIHANKTGLRLFKHAVCFASLQDYTSAEESLLNITQVPLNVSEKSYYFLLNMCRYHKFLSVGDLNRASDTLLIASQFANSANDYIGVSLGLINHHIEHFLDTNFVHNALSALELNEINLTTISSHIQSGTLQKENPYTLIFSPAKAGTTSLVVGLQKSEIPYDKIHSLLGAEYIPDTLPLTKKLHSLLASGVKKYALSNNVKPYVKVISGIREPISWFLSFIFHFHDLLKNDAISIYGNVNHDTIMNYITELFATFTEHYTCIESLNTSSVQKFYLYNLKNYLLWFDNDFSATLNRNINLDTLKSRGVYSDNKTLFYQFESIGSIQSNLQVFLNNNSFTLTKCLPSSQAKYINLYNDTKNNLRLSSNIVQSIYDIANIQRFYSDENIHDFYTKYS